MLHAHGNTAEASTALAALCQNYWRPLYAYVLKRVGNEHEAQDLTQSFFQRMLEKNYLADANPERGRFRAFLLTAFKHFLSNEWAKARAKKRGGGQTIISLDFGPDDSCPPVVAADHLTPEQVYERQWALTLLDRVMQRLERQWTRSGKSAEYQALKPFLIGQRRPGFADAAKTLGMTEPAARMAASRMRKRYRSILREEIAETVATAEDVEDELNRLFAILAR